MTAALRIAWRYLVCRKSHSSVGVITVVSMLGVAVATTAIVCVLSVFNGFAEVARERVSMVDAPLKVVPAKGKMLACGDSLAAALEALPEVDRAVAVVSENALAVYGGRQMAVTMRGVPEGNERVTRLSETVIDGDYTVLSDDSLAGGVISVGTALQLGARPLTMDIIQLYVPRRVGRISAATAANSFLADSLVVTGVYRTNDSDHDASTVVVPIEMARRLLQMDSGEASAIEIAPASGVSDDKAIAAIRKATGDGYTVLTLLEQEEQSFKMIAVEKWITFVMLAFILIIASFNIISTLSILIIEKDDNIRTMRNLGATQGQLRSIFFYEGWLVSAVGGLAGLVVGIGLSLAQQIGEFIKISGNEAELSIVAYPVKVEVADILVIALLVMAVGAVIGWIASRFVPRR
ncbi:MAG: FtsX-like permease family protein [Paramuribaculum sp.]|nr:FtsX-like permease family protein [Paramuribaculum sp.]